MGAAATLGYGLTEGLEDEGSHHRALGSLAASLAPVPWGAFAVRFDGRLDFHPDDGLGSDESAVGEPRLIGRLGTAASDAIAVGAELVILLPGEDAPSIAFDGTSVDAKGLLAWSDHRRLTFGASAGFRLDRTAETAPPLATLRDGDRMTLAASDANAVLLAFGAAQQLGRLELLEELSWDLLVGDAAPKALESPLRASLGARYRMSDALVLAVDADVGLSSRPDMTAVDAYVPIEPRVAGLIGLRYSPRPTRAEPPVAQPPPKVEPSPVAAPAPAPEAVQAARVSVDGEVLNELGGPVRGATLTLEGSDPERLATTDADGRFHLDDVVPGSARLRIEGPNLKPTTLAVELGSAALSLAVERVEPMGTLRCAVASFEGDPLSARVTIEPGARSVEADATGSFELDLPPGRYTVTLEKRGYRRQVRHVDVEDGGVTVVNVELRRRR